MQEVFADTPCRETAGGVMFVYLQSLDQYPGELRFNAAKVSHMALAAFRA